MKNRPKHLLRPSSNAWCWCGRTIHRPKERTRKEAEADCQTCLRTLKNVRAEIRRETMAHESAAAI